MEEKQQVPEPPSLSRVHRLAKLSRIELTGIYIRLCDSVGESEIAKCAVPAWDRDQLVTGILNMIDYHFSEVQL